MLPLNLVACNPKSFPSTMHLGSFGYTRQTLMWDTVKLLEPILDRCVGLLKAHFRSMIIHNLLADLPTDNTSHIAHQAAI